MEKGKSKKDLIVPKTQEEIKELLIEVGQQFFLKIEGGTAHEIAVKEIEAMISNEFKKASRFRDCLYRIMSYVVNPNESCIQLATSMIERAIEHSPDILEYKVHKGRIQSCGAKNIAELREVLQYFVELQKKAEGMELTDFFREKMDSDVRKICDEQNKPETLENLKELHDEAIKLFIKRTGEAIRCLEQISMLLQQLDRGEGDQDLTKKKLDNLISLFARLNTGNTAEELDQACIKIGKADTPLLRMLEDIKRKLPDPKPTGDSETIEGSEPTTSGRN